MTSEPPRTVFFLSDFGTGGRVRRRGARGHRRPRPGNDGHRPDPSHPALRRARREPHVGAGGAAPRLRRGARRRRPRRRHGAPRHRPCGSRCPPAGPWPSSGPTTGCWSPRRRPRPRRRSRTWSSWRASRRRPTGARPSTGAICSRPAAAALCTGAALEELGRADRPGVVGAPRSAASSRRAACTTAASVCAPRSPGWTASATCNWRRPWPTPASPASP